MENFFSKTLITETFDNVRQLSFVEKTDTSFEERKINDFLEEILLLKSVLKVKTEKINTLLEKIEQITWLNNLDIEALISVNDLIASIRGLYTSLLSQFNALHFISSKKVANEEINNFKSVIDELKEIANDLE